jgi:hypothetical protein
MEKPMRITARLLLWGLVWIPSLAGCSVLTKDRFIDPGFQGRNPNEVNILPGVKPRQIPIRLPHLPALSAIPPSAKAGSFRGLSETECIVDAANASTAGRLLDAKARECSEACKRNCRHDTAGTDLRAEILRVAAIEARNRSAAGALEVFYRLEQAHAQREVLQESLTTVDRALQDRDRLLGLGVAIPAQLDVLRQQRFDLQSRMVELDQAIVRLSTELKDLLNLGSQDEPWLVWPLVEVKVDTQPIDVEAAVQAGLARRPEVSLLRRLDAMQSSDTLRALKVSLSMVNPLLGLDCGSSAGSRQAMLLLLCSRGDSSQDLASVRNLWDVYRQAREQEIAKDIRLAALAVQSSVQQVAVATGRLQHWEDRIGQLKAKEAGGMASPMERTDAELKLYEARASLWKSIVDWQIAVAQLRREQFALLPEGHEVVNVVDRKPSRAVP